MEMNNQPLPLARVQPTTIFVRILFGLVLNVAMLSLGTASEIASIMTGLDADSVATADKLLALGDAENRDPQLVRSFVQTARHIGRQGHWQKSISLLQRARLVSQSNGASGNKSTMTRALNTTADNTAVFGSSRITLSTPSWG